MAKKWVHSLPVRADFSGSTYGEAPIDHPIPAPIGIKCPDHPTFPLVWAVHMDKPSAGWCRFGQHIVLLTNAEK